MPGKNQEVSGVVRSARLCVTCQHSHLGHMSNPDPDDCSNTFGNVLLSHHAENGFKNVAKISCHKAQILPSTSKTSCTTVNFLKAHVAVAAATLAAFSTSVKPPTSLVHGGSSRFWCCPIHSQPTIVISCSMFGLGIGFVIKSSGFTLVPTFFVTNLFLTWMPPVPTSFCMST